MSPIDHHKRQGGMHRAPRSPLAYRALLMQEFLVNVGNGIVAGGALSVLCLIGWKLIAR